MPLIDAKDYHVLNAVDSDDRYNWDAIAALFLRQHLVTVRQKRDDFKNSRPAQHDSASTYVRDLQRRLQEWLSAAQVKKKYSALCNFLVQEYLMEQLPQHLRLHLQEKEACTLDDIVATLDKYFDLRPESSLHNLCKEQDNLSVTSNSHKATPRPSNGPNKTSRLPTNSNGIYVPPAVRSMAPHDNWRQGPRPEGSPQGTPAPANRGATPNSNRHQHRAMPYQPEAHQNTVPRPPYTASSPTTDSMRYAPQQRPSHRQTSGGCEFHGPNSAHTTAECRRIQPRHTPESSPDSGSTEYGPSTRPFTPHPQQTTPQSHQVRPHPSVNANAIVVEPDANAIVVEPERVVNAFAVVTTPENPSSAGGDTRTMPRAQVKTCKGTLNSQDVTVLLDSGSDHIFVARKFVTPASYTGEKVTARTAAGPIPGCPIAAASFHCPYLKQGATRVVVLDDPSYDVLLGRVPGSSPFEEKEEDPRFHPPETATVLKKLLPSEPLLSPALPSTTAPLSIPSVVQQAAPVDVPSGPQVSRAVTLGTQTTSVRLPFCSNTWNYGPTNIGWNVYVPPSNRRTSLPPLWATTFPFEFHSRNSSPPLPIPLTSRTGTFPTPHQVFNPTISAPSVQY